jgi:hypothetical protein
MMTMKTTVGSRERVKSATVIFEDQASANA